MTDAPERIWVWPDYNDHFNPAKQDWTHGFWDSTEDSRGTEYARADRIEALSKERVELNDRIIAMETGDWSEVRLVRFENGQFDLTAGPIPAIAEYLAQMMEDGNGEYFNFMEMQINHKSAGPMVLSLQRKNGRTPNELRKEAEAKLSKAVEALEWQASQPEAHPFMAQHARTTLAEIKGEKT
jgi:hypothetical protein